MSTEALTKAQRALVRSNPDASRLLAHVAFDDDADCWLWSGAASDKGYGYMAFRGKTWKAHRVSYSLFCGEIPAGLLVCHHCDNPRCVNPHHLFLGHATTNMQDMVRKGRQARTITSAQDHFRVGPASGEKAGGHKLTEAIAVAILDKAVSGALTSDLASEYGVDRTSVQRLLRGETWKHLTRPAGLPRRVGAYQRNAGRAALATKENSDAG